MGSVILVFSTQGISRSCAAVIAFLMHENQETLKVHHAVLSLATHRRPGEWAGWSWTSVPALSWGPDKGLGKEKRKNWGGEHVGMAGRWDLRMRSWAV